MLLPLHPRGAVPVAEQVDVVDGVGVVPGVRVPGPLQVAQSAPAAVVAPAVGHRRVEVLPQVIGCEERGPARLAVHVGRLDGSPEVGLRRHVYDGVVHEDAVELPPEADATHVALDVLALRVEVPAHPEHVGRAVDERQVEARLEVGGVVAAAAPELEQRLCRPLTVLQQGALVEGRLLGVLGRGRQQRPPVGQLAIELRGRRGAPAAVAAALVIIRVAPDRRLRCCSNAPHGRRGGRQSRRRSSRASQSAAPATSMPDPGATTLLSSRCWSVSGVKAGHAGRSGRFGSPVAANCTQ